MAARTGNRLPYEPDYAVPPGETLLETISGLGMDQKELATRLGLSEKHVSQMINGHVPVSYDVADKLELVTGVPARLWNNLEMNYRERLAKIEAAKRLEADLDWLKRVPTKELADRGKIEAGSTRPGCSGPCWVFSGLAAWRRGRPCGSSRPPPSGGHAASKASRKSRRLG